MTPKVFDTIIAEIAAGKAVRTSLAEHQVSVYKFYGTLDADPEAAARYARAKESAIEALLDEAHEILDNCPETNEGISKARARADIRKWAASKLKPKRYGDRLDVDHTGNITVNVNEGTASAD